MALPVSVRPDCVADEYTVRGSDPIGIESNITFYTYFSKSFFSITIQPNDSTKAVIFFRSSARIHCAVGRRTKIIDRATIINNMLSVVECMRVDKPQSTRKAHITCCYYYH